MWCYVVVSTLVECCLTSLWRQTVTALVHSINIVLSSLLLLTGRALRNLLWNRYTIVVQLPRLFEQLLLIVCIWPPFVRLLLVRDVPAVDLLIIFEASIA